MLAANITCFGDSITAGHSSSTGGYPPKLSNMLNGNGKPATVVNKGISGEKTPAGVARFDSVLNSFAANIILIMEGTNDIRGGLSVATTQHNLQVMINKAKAKGVIPVLATLTPSDRSGSTTLIPNTWNPMIKSLASSNGIVLSDQYAGIIGTWSTSTADGLHPNDTGYRTVAQTWYNSMSGMISSSGEVSESGGGGGGGSSSCFIATAAFGSPMEKHVFLLREFRDEYLLTSDLGSRFVSAYYKYSPPLANVIAEHDLLRQGTRILLYPLVGLSFILVKLSIVQQLFLAVIFLSLLSGGAILRQKRQRG